MLPIPSISRDVFYVHPPWPGIVKCAHYSDCMMSYFVYFKFSVVSDLFLDLYIALMKVAVGDRNVCM